VRLDAASETRPIAGHVAAYQEVYERYRNQLRDL
jgi:xylulokinase